MRSGQRARWALRQVCSSCCVDGCPAPLAPSPCPRRARPHARSQIAGLQDSLLHRLLMLLLPTPLQPSYTYYIDNLIANTVASQKVSLDVTSGILFQIPGMYFPNTTMTAPPDPTIVNSSTCDTTVLVSFQAGGPRAGRHARAHSHSAIVAVAVAVALPRIAANRAMCPHPQAASTRPKMS